jgi:hypothetical protein
MDCTDARLIIHAHEKRSRHKSIIQYVGYMKIARPGAGTVAETEVETAEMEAATGTAMGTATRTVLRTATGTAMRTATGTATGTALRTATGTALRTATGTAMRTATGTADRSDLIVAFFMIFAKITDTDDAICAQRGHILHFLRQ